MAPKRISIAMATYNGATFIEEQLASFVAQERRPDELVVTDDGSSDGTVTLAHNFARRAPFPVRIECNAERLGYTRNFERAIGLTKGNLIFISDQDDAWHPQKIRKVADTLASAPNVAVCVNDQWIVDAQGSSKGATMFGNFRRAGFPDTELIAGSCTAFPRSLLPLLLPIADGVPYDSWIGAVADSLAIKVLIEEPLQTFRRHQDNASNPIVATGSPTKWSAFKRYGLSDPRGGWAAEIGWRSELVERLMRMREEVDELVGEQHRLHATNLNQRRIEALRKRSELLQSPRWRRSAVIVQSWNSGLYREFLGLKSALKDLVRP